MRLNTGGALLSAQEIRNCSCRMVDGGEEFYTFLQRLSESEDFQKTVVRLSDSDREQRGAEELVLRFFAIDEYLDGYHGNVKEWLDGFMEDILIRNRIFDYQEKEERFNKVFSFIAAKWGGDAFARYNKDNVAGGRLPPAYFEAVCGGVLANLDHLDTINTKRAKSTLVDVVQSQEFKDNTGPGANNITKLTNRIAIFADALRKI